MKVSEEHQDALRELLNIGGALKGTVGLAFPPKSAVRLVSLLTGEKSDSDDLDSMRAGTLGEVGNIILNSVMGAIGNFLSLPIEFGLPSLDHCPLARLVEECIASNDATIMVGRTRFDVTELRVDGEILVVFEADSVRSLLQALHEVEATSD